MEHRIFDTLLEPVFILNSVGKVVYCNEPGAIICGLSVRKVTRAGSFAELFTFSEPLEFLAALSSVQEATPYKEISFTTPENTSGKVQITCQQLEAGENPLWIVYFRDVTLEETLQKKYRAELEKKESVIQDLEKAQIELQNYSKNLEKMVDERTAQLRRLNQHLAALLDSLGQGFFVFDREGACLDIYSKACEHTLETIPTQKKVWEVLKLPADKVAGFEKWMLTAFEEMLPFEDLAPLAPPHFAHSQGLHISLEYYPMRNSENAIEGIVVVATDVTSLMEAKRDAEVERAHAKMILSLIRNKKEITGFIKESQQILDEVDHTLNSPDFDDDLLYRYFHTLKGGASSFSIQTLAEECHQAENTLSEFKNNRQDQMLYSSLKQRSTEIRNKFSTFIEDNKVILGAGILRGSRVIELDAPNLLKFYTQLAQQNGPMAQSFLKEFIMEPIGGFFQHYNEVIQQVAGDLGKELKPLKLVNSDILILPEAYSRFFASLIHSFRNSVDHGIESPEVRYEKGKESAGQIEVHFNLQGERLQIKICDDGAGVDPERIRKKLQTKGIDCSHESDNQVIQHIFDSDFSTRNEVTALSGRGVGMDAIKEAVMALGGTVVVHSQLGMGTQLHIELPYFEKPLSDIMNSTAA